MSPPVLLLRSVFETMCQSPLRSVHLEPRLVESALLKSSPGVAADVLVAVGLLVAVRLLVGVGVGVFVGVGDGVAVGVGVGVGEITSHYR
jgi:hypothetical protein